MTEYQCKHGINTKEWCMFCDPPSALRPVERGGCISAPLSEEESKAFDFVEKYANGGAMCSECTHSKDDGPGFVHVCKVLDGDDPAECPALPEELYPPERGTA